MGPDQEAGESEGAAEEPAHQARPNERGCRYPPIRWDRGEHQECGKTVDGSGFHRGEDLDAG